MKQMLLATLLLSTVSVAQSPLPSGIDRAGMAPTVKPGDDFERYANGGWSAVAVIPPDRSSLGSFIALRDLSDQRQKALITDLSTHKPVAGSEARKVADYYNAYLDTAAIEKRGTTPIRAELAAIAGIRDKAALGRVLGTTLRADADPLNSGQVQTDNIFGLWITQSLDDPTRTMPYVLQGGIGMPDRDYYLSPKPDMAEARVAYQAYIAKIFALAGFADAPARAAAVMALETKIANAHLDIVASQDVHKADNVWTIKDFQAKAPGIDWPRFWTAAGLGQQKDFIVWQPGTVTGIAALVASEPLAVWRDWLAFHHISQVASVLPKAFDDARFEFYGKTLQGTSAQRPRDIRAIAATNAALGDAIGKLYVERHFPASSKADIQHMVSGILTAFDARVAALDWMTPATKAEARRKIETMRVGIGYPESWEDYTPLVIRVDDPVGNLQRSRLAATKRQLAKIGKPVDRGEWWMTPQTVNAVNLPLQNALNFPAAILQPPFYDPARDAAANYGGIGATIGHEISHSFDNTGADFDAAGRLHNWWTPEDLKRFEASGKALADQYSAYEPLPGLHLNGELVLGENIADVAGLTASLEAYHASLGGKPAPVIDGMTGDQRLFLAFAQVWRSKMRDAALRSQIATNGHSPGRFRAMTVRNLDDWYTAFGVKPGDALYLPPEKRVHVW